MPLFQIRQRRPGRIAGSGAAFPDGEELENAAVLRLASPIGPRGPRTAAELAELADNLAESLGVRRRRWCHRVGEPFAADERTSTDLLTRAARQALLDARVDPSELGALVAATSTPARVTRPAAPEVAHRLGARCAAFDVRAGCAGGLYALVQGFLLGEAGGAPVVVVAADTFSKVAPPREPLAALALGDGAGALVLVPGARAADPGAEGGPAARARPAVVGTVGAREGPALLGAALGAEGAHGDLATAPSPFPPTAEAIAAGLYFLGGSPDELARVAPPLYAEACGHALAAAGLSPDEVDLFIPHQASRASVEAVARAVGIPLERTLCHVERHANIGSAALLVALHEALVEGRVRPEQRVLLAALGGGVCFGAAVLRV